MMDWLEGLFRKRLVLEIRKPQDAIEADEAFICTRMGSLRKTENYKILQTLWASDRARLIGDLKSCDDEKKALMLARELRGFERAANMAITWAKRDPQYKTKEREALRRHQARVKAAFKG